MSCYKLVELKVEYWVVIVGYDYILTLKGEIDYVWRRKLSGATVIFFVNRYFLIAAVALLVLESVSWETTKVSVVRDMCCDR